MNSTTAANRVNEVLNLLDGLITLDIQKRVTTLDSIMKVYQGTYPFVRMSLDVDAENKIARANKAAALAVGGSTLEERETAYMSAIRIFEKVYMGVRGWGAAFGSLDNTLVTLNQKREELIQAKIWAEQNQRKLEQEFAGLMSFLNTVFAQFSVTFGVVFEQTQPRLFNAMRQVTFGRDYLNELRNMEPLKVAFTEAHTVAKALSVTKDGDGRPVLDSANIANVFPVVVAALYNATQMQKISVKVEVEKVRKNVVDRTPGSRQWAHVATTGKGGGLFRPGSYLAMLYDRITQCPGITFTDLFDGIPAKDPERMFQTIAERGLAANKFTLTKDRDGVVHFKGIK